MRRDDYAKATEDQGFRLVYNPPGDSNCQFLHYRTTQRDWAF